MSNSKRAQGNSRRRSARRTAAEEKWLYITTGLTGAAKAFTGNDMDDTREKIDIASEVNALQYKRYAQCVSPDILADLFVVGKIVKLPF